MRPATLIVAFILLVAGPFFYTQSRLRRTGVISSDPAQSVQTAASPISSPSRISSAMFTPKAPPPSTITTAISNPSTPAAAVECSYVSQQAAIEADAFKRDGSSQCWGEKGANRRVAPVFVFLLHKNSAGTTHFLDFYTNLLAKVQNGAFVDVGANIGGYFERMRAQLLAHPEWRVLAFEPNPSVCK